MAAEKFSKPLDTDLVFPKPERPFVSDDEALIAMRENKLEIVVAWYERLQEEADRDPSAASKTHLAVRMANLEHAAGLIEMAIETLEDARADAFERRDDATVVNIDRLITEFRG